MDSQTWYPNEIQNFCKIWVLAITSLLYCFFVSSRIPSGIPRLLSVLPVVFLFIILPFNLSSILLSLPTVFYLVWLANFKLVLFAFNQGPLSAHQSLLHFTSIALLPIKTATHHHPPPHPSAVIAPAVFAIKTALLIPVISIYSYRQHLHQTVILTLYFCHLYLGVDLVLAATAFPVRMILGMEIEPQFNEPYLSTSLQDFWGRRWNLMVTSILRPTVYSPVRDICTPFLGRDLSLAAGIMATFLASGLMHELIYYYLSRAIPTWEVTWFFILHGFCVAVEIAGKKGLKKRKNPWRLHWAFSGPITVGFVGVTGSWLFLPQIVRSGLDLKVINESYVLFNVVRESLALMMGVTSILFLA